MTSKVADGKEIYIGDGVYASYINGMIKLRTQRDNGDHFIYLEPEVCQSLFEFANAIWGAQVKED